MPSTIGWIVYLGAAPTALGFATWAFALGRMSASRLASLAYLIPVVAILLGWALLDETPPRPAIVGGTLCVTGVYLARRPNSRADPVAPSAPTVTTLPPQLVEMLADAHRADLEQQAELRRRAGNDRAATSPLVGRLFARLVRSVRRPVRIVAGGATAGQIRDGFGGRLDAGSAPAVRTPPPARSPSTWN